MGLGSWTAMLKMYRNNKAMCRKEWSAEGIYKTLSSTLRAIIRTLEKALGY